MTLNLSTSVDQVFERTRFEISTIASSDHYQHYVPLFCYTIRKAYPEVKIAVGLTGDMDDITAEAMKHYGYYELRQAGTSASSMARTVITTHVQPRSMPTNESTVNTMRFLFFLDYLDDHIRAHGIEHMIVTDVDFLFFNSGEDLLRWHIQRMQDMKTCYSGYHGAKKFPKRFPGSWKGDLERVAGGSIMLTKEWFKKTVNARLKFATMLNKGEIGTYREEDEVVLCKIIKESGLPVPPDKNFPIELRGIHLGDFKFDERWADTEKMHRYLHHTSLYKYIELVGMDNRFRNIRNVVCKDPEIDKVFDHLHTHCKARGFGGYEQHRL